MYKFFFLQQHSDNSISSHLVLIVLRLRVDCMIFSNDRWSTKKNIFHTMQKVHNFSCNVNDYVVCVTEQCSLLVYGMCANLCFLIHRILKFQNSQLRTRINTKPNGKQKSSGEGKWIFCLLITSLPMYLKSRGLRTDHKRVKKIET